MCTYEKAKQIFLQYLPVPQCTTHSKVICGGHNPSFICWKHMHMQISFKPVVQACDDFEIGCTPQRKTN